MSRPCRALMAVALVCVMAAMAPWAASAQGRPAVVVDLSVLDALSPPGAANRPSWRPPIPERRPIPPIFRQRPIIAEPDNVPVPVAAPPSEPAPSDRPAPTAPQAVPHAQAEAPAAPLTVRVRTAPVNWRRPIPVTANAFLIQQVGVRSTVSAPSEKLIGANIDVEATADIISALPNGDGFRMLFVNDRTALSDTGERLLDTLAERMAEQADLRLSVLAYAGGSPETASRSRVLSLERALAVRNYLSEHGVRGSRMDLRALGNTYADGPPERVDLLLLTE